MPEVKLLAPVSGRLVAMESVPDPVFAEKMIGDGIAIDPDAGEVRSPVDGTVETVFPTGHAVGIRTAEGLEILIHIGIDSVKHANLFQAVVTTGATVKAGDVLVRFDLAALKQKAASTITPLVITAAPDGSKLSAAAAGSSVRAGVDTVLTVSL